MNYIALILTLLLASCNKEVIVKTNSNNGLRIVKPAICKIPQITKQEDNQTTFYNYYTQTEKYINCANKTIQYYQDIVKILTND